MQLVEYVRKLREEEKAVTEAKEILKQIGEDGRL